MDYPFDGSQTILRYTVVDEKMSAKENRENFSKMKELLNKVGVYFDIIDGTLILKVSPASSGIEIVIMCMFFVKFFQEMARFFPV